MIARARTLVAAGLLLGLGACVDGLAPGELGAGRLIGVYPGEVAAVLPPMTDRAGNLYVATGQPDATGAPLPGVAQVGGPRGGWSEPCATGEGPTGAARGWIGATDGKGWLWTGTAILELDAATRACTTRLDRDPVSSSDVVFHAVAPLVEETVSGTFAVGVIATGAAPDPHVTTLDLELGVIREVAPLGAVQVLGAGADRERGEGLFLVRDAGGVASIVRARPNGGVTGTTSVAGDVTAIRGDLAVGSDGTIAAVAGDTAVLVGDAAGVRLVTVAGRAIAVDRDDDGALWLVGDAGGAPTIAAVERDGVAASAAWTCAQDTDARLRAGVVVVDERGGERTTARWEARSALGPLPLVAPRSAPPYAVGARAWLIADPPVDRGGIPYSQIAVIPIGVEFP